MRYLPLVCAVAAFGAAFAGCKGLNEGLLHPLPDGGGDASADAAMADAGDGQVGPADAAPDAPTSGDACVPSEETCNDRDDDCDGTRDDGAEAWCASVYLNSVVECDAVCVPLRCVDGFFSCDGLPQNGCEANYCDCHVCPDDAGADDGG